MHTAQKNKPHQSFFSLCVRNFFAERKITNVLVGNLQKNDWNCDKNCVYKYHPEKKFAG